MVPKIDGKYAYDERGLPYLMASVYFGKDSVKTIFMNYCNDKRDEKDMERLKEWVVYFINAPAFNNPWTDELRAMDLMNMSFEKLLSNCMRYGIDPF